LISDQAEACQSKLSSVTSPDYFEWAALLDNSSGTTSGNCWHHYVPKPMTSKAWADWRFNNDTFVYYAAKNEYICPTGEALILRYTNLEKGLT